jgi:2-keto-3-deoxy-L-rhamnonate aldolase RhmA
VRDNSVKQKLASGGVSVGTMNIEFFSTGIGRILAGAGAEFCAFDMEHSGWSMETIRQVMATSRSADLAPLVRITRTDAAAQYRQGGAILPSRRQEESTA